MEPNLLIACPRPLATNRQNKGSLDCTALNTTPGAPCPAIRLVRPTNDTHNFPPLSQCGEGQSIVKVWGRGGHAKDVRGLVMDLNARAGRGEDPSNAVRSAGAQQSRSHDARNSSSGNSSYDSDRAYPQHRAQHDTSAAGLGPQGFGFVSANHALRVDDVAVVLPLSGHGTAGPTKWHGGNGTAETWHERQERGGGSLEEAPARSVGGFGMSNASGSGGYDQGNADRPASPPRQWAFEQVRGSSRWGVFSSERGMGGLGRYPGLDSQVGACAIDFHATCCRGETGICFSSAGRVCSYAADYSDTNFF